MSPSTFLQQSGLAAGKLGDAFGTADMVPKPTIRKDSAMFNIKTPEIMPSSSLTLDLNKDHKTRSQLGDNNSSFQMPSMMHMAA